MKTTKKILLSLAACCVLFGLVGCGDKNTNPYEGMTDEEFYYAIFENATYVSDDDIENKNYGKLSEYKTDTWYAFAAPVEGKLASYADGHVFVCIKIADNKVYRYYNYDDDEINNEYFDLEAYKKYLSENNESFYFGNIPAMTFIEGFYWTELDSYANEIINSRLN